MAVGGYLNVSGSNVTVKNLSGLVPNDNGCLTCFLTYECEVISSVKSF